MENIRALFPEYEVEPILKGWSTDSKYLLNRGEEKFTLRVSKTKSIQRQKEEFQTIGSIKPMDQLIRPLSYGRLDEKHTFILYSYVEGEDLKEVIVSLDPVLQYDMGIQAGVLLTAIHEVETAGREEVRVRYNRRITDKISAYRQCPVKHVKLEEYIPYVEANRPLLEKRPTVLLHGDYHLGNMILKEQSVHIIDFNRYDFGDPYEEFDRMTMNSSFSPQFSKGLLHGYFKGVPPMKFWRLLKLYALTNALGSISWAQKYSPESMDFIHEMIDQTLADYADKSSPIPGWYRQLIGWQN
ncbi:phosphotransferase [Proteiniclasticum sp. SCR006]|uniref:Phosphotransferase n=1 Tax=Proteiniclasticum aestuarii TaxID=2817862 RepID=A0A939HC07_9CLOT|nr:phosphotransferase [Proteiniclasticum aestuarii]MBO1265668.1 phosphotransferase [Proteiniclasticum aestuarii]